MLDVGTDNEALLNDPLYVGVRHSRTRGPAYDRLIEAYVSTASRLFPQALLHFEDFGPSNARRILLEYADKACIFNDDMQGTGAITLAAILAGVRVAGTPLADQRVVVFGAGTAGVGIADQIRDAMIRAGAGPQAATGQVWLVDNQGLLLVDMADLRDFQTPYARPADEAKSYDRDDEGRISLATTVAEVHPTILVGTSTAGGAFTEPIIREMAAHVDPAADFPAVQRDREDRGPPGRSGPLDRGPGADRHRHPLGAGRLPGGGLPDRAGQQRAGLPRPRAGHRGRPRPNTSPPA
jgi:malate dehydrogenase (oxaloacetate-decarboxylating)